MVLRYDKRRNTLVVQSIIMILIAGVMFYQYSLSKQIIYLVLCAFSFAFIAIYFYRMFIMRVVFEDDKVTFKGLYKKYCIRKEEIHDIQILKQVGREVNHVKYIKGGDYKQIGNKSYVLIRKTSKSLQISLSMFNAASNDYISFEYIEGIEKYLDKLLEK